ncbi:hypothetical protein [Leclercia sp. W6]|uniref:hypothetical protein n=1 Tax=Leclercia sp. W6 TaxID=2282310 RepID=UPI001AEFDA29|nr:hypothetical protein [Leclercia sp. W6]
MNRSDHERLTDELIGEATFSLLKDNGPISMKLLLERLQQMLSVEQDGQRRHVLSRIILEISNDGKDSTRRNTKSERQEWDTDGRHSSSNVYPLFGNSPQANRNKH